MKHDLPDIMMAIITVCSSIAMLSLAALIIKLLIWRDN